MNGDWFAEVDASTTVAEVAERLGLTVRGRRIVEPPCCNRTDKRGSATAYAHTWSCACGAKGSVAQLVRAKLSATDWVDVRAWFADAGWCSPDGTRSTWVAPPPRPAPPPPAYPELGDFLTLGGPVEDDAEVLAFWRSRGFGPRTGAAWALPTHATWPAWWGCGHARLWRLACPMYDAGGVARSIHARAIREPGVYHGGPRNGDKRPKTHAPGGVRGDSLLFADPWLGVPLLQGREPVCDILVIEGITDFCATTSVEIPELAILGVISGSAQALRHVRLPRLRAGMRDRIVYVGTHNDPAGDKYAAEVRAAVGDRAECRRVVWGLRRATGADDASDIVKAGVSVRARLDAAR